MRYKITGCIIAWLVAMTVYISFSSAQVQSTKVDDPWAGFQFLIGNWSNAILGKPGEAIGTTSFSFDLGQNILVRRNKVEYPPKPGEKSGMIHEDLMIIYRLPNDSLFRAIYFDNESHVINYTATFPAKQPSVVFESEESDKSPRFRLVYQMESDDLLNIEFLIAPPGGAFQTYTKGAVKRTK